MPPRKGSHHKENMALGENDHQQGGKGSLAFCNGARWLTESSVELATLL